MATTPLTLEQFGQKVKAQHPQYSDMGDVELARNVLNKYPEYQDMIGGVPAAPIPEGLRGPNEPHGLMHGNAPIQEAVDEAAEAPRLDSFGHFFGDLGAGATRLMLSPVAHPLETAKGVAKTVGAFANPQFAADMAKQAGEQFARNPGGEAVANIPQALLALVGGPEAVSREPSGVPLRPFDPLSEYRSPLIPHSEAVARAATDILRPNPLEARGVESTLMRRMPDIRSAFAESGTKVKNPLVFAKQAGKLGKEASDFYKSNFIEPLNEVPSGSGTVGSQYAELSNINDKLRPIYRARSMGEQLSKEATDHMAELERQRDMINENLYKTISDRTGLPVEQIQDINQRGGQLQHLGDVADVAQRARRAGVSGYTSSGLPIPMTMAEHALRLVDYLRGGPEAVAGRKLNRVMEMSEGQPSVFPDPQEIANNRLNYQLQEADRGASNRMASAARKPAGLGPTQPPTAFAVPDIEGAERISSNIAGRNAARESQAATNRAEATREFLRHNEGEQTAQDLAAQRAARAQAYREARDKLTEAARKANGETRRSMARENFR